MFILINGFSGFACIYTCTSIHHFITKLGEGGRGCLGQLEIDGQLVPPGKAHNFRPTLLLVN